MCRKGIIIIMLMQLLLVGAFTYNGAEAEVTVDNREKTLGIVTSVSSQQRVIDYGTITREILPCDISAEEYEMLLRIVEAEAGGEDTEGKILVANVVLNRVESDKFPDTIEEVIFQKNGKVTQFSPVADGRYYTVEVSEDTIEAVNRALSGEDLSQGALYFAARSSADSDNMRWFDRHLTFLFKHGGHEFFF
ncbi:MAG: cell wall hydrolase [Lachnospiraceae bacterium]|nr:cell wall hydrolase [Lachnospiraceae bacterium]